MNGMFTSSSEVQRDQLDWGELGWLSRPKTTNGTASAVVEVTLNPRQGHDFHKHPNQEEVIYVIAGDESHPVMGSSALSRLVKLGQRYGYDVVVHVGIARYLRAKQRTEIQAELLEHRGIELSEASISNLCDRFLCYFEALHLARVYRMNFASSCPCKGLNQIY